MFWEELSFPLILAVADLTVKDFVDSTSLGICFSVFHSGNNTMYMFVYLSCCNYLLDYLAAIEISDNGCVFGYYIGRDFMSKQAFKSVSVLSLILPLLLTARPFYVPFNPPNSFGRPYNVIIPQDLIQILMYK